MALIKCNECGHMVSDKAETCPNCGCPVEYDYNVISSKKGNKPLPVIIITLFVIVTGFAVWLYINKNAETSKLEETAICEENNDNADDEISIDNTVEITESFINAIHKYDQVDEFSEGLAAVRKGDLWGYINVKGEEVINCQYHEHVGKFSHGLACVPKGDGIKFINKRGETILDNGYERPFYLMSGSASGLRLPCFVDDFCLVDDAKSNHNGLLINTNGERVREYNYYDDIQNTYGVESDLVRPDENVYRRFELDGLYGYKDKSGNIIIPAKYNEIGTLNNGVFLANISCLDETLCNAMWDLNLQYTIWGYVDENGNETFTVDDYNKIGKIKSEREEARRANKRDIYNQN